MKGREHGVRFRAIGGVGADVAPAHGAARIEDVGCGVSDAALGRHEYVCRIQQPPRMNGDALRVGKRGKGETVCRCARQFRAQVCLIVRAQGDDFPARVTHHAISVLQPTELRYAMSSAKGAEKHDNRGFAPEIMERHGLARRVRQGKVRPPFPHAHRRTVPSRRRWAVVVVLTATRGKQHYRSKYQDGKGPRPNLPCCLIARTMHLDLPQFVATRE